MAKAKKKAQTKPGSRKKRGRLILVESTEPVEDIKEKLRAEGIKDIREVELWLRTPDDSKAEPIHYAARLCTCTTVCIQTNGPPPPPRQPKRRK